jgi:hypothetical protein
VFAKQFSTKNSQVTAGCQCPLYAYCRGVSCELSLFDDARTKRPLFLLKLATSFQQVTDRATPPLGPPVKDLRKSTDADFQQSSCGRKHDFLVWGGKDFLVFIVACAYAMQLPAHRKKLDKSIFQLTYFSNWLKYFDFSLRNVQIFIIRKLFLVVVCPFKCTTQILK